MKKTLKILSIMVLTCISPAWGNDINQCKTKIPALFEKHCDDEGYKTDNGLGAAPSYGAYKISDNRVIFVACYKYKTSFKELKKDIANKCNIESEQIAELNNLSRPSTHVKKTQNTQAETKTFTGTVRDETETLIGANVRIPNTNPLCACQTDTDGNFNLTCNSTPPSDAVLEITYIGYTKQTIPLKNFKSGQTITMSVSIAQTNTAS